MHDLKRAHKQAYKPFNDQITDRESLAEMIAGGLLLAVVLTVTIWYGFMQATGGF